jgi:GntR family transcriptional repressor for pyruvate dehydrogenase complex
VRRVPDDGKVLSDLVERRRHLPEVLEARAALEAHLALGAQRRTMDELRAIRRALERMETEIEMGEIGAAGEEHSHGAVTRAAHNDVMRALMGFLAGPIEETCLESLSEPGRPRRSLANHRAIAEAIEQAGPAQAAEAMRRNITNVWDVAIPRNDSDEARR